MASTAIGSQTRKVTFAALLFALAIGLFATQFFVETKFLSAIAEFASGAAFIAAAAFIEQVYGLRGKKLLQAALVLLFGLGFLLFVFHEPDAKVRSSGLVLGAIILIPATGAVFHDRLSINLRLAFYGAPIVVLWSLETLGAMRAIQSETPTRWLMVIGLAPITIGLTALLVFMILRWRRIQAPNA